MSLTSIDYSELDEFDAEYSGESDPQSTLLMYAIHDLIYVSDKLRNMDHRDLADDIDRIVSTLR